MGIFEAGFMGKSSKHCSSSHPAKTLTQSPKTQPGQFYLTQFYKRNEIAFRLSIFYGTVTIAGAFSGFISFGVFQVQQQQHNHLHGWQYLFLIEGSCTLIVASLALWLLPANKPQCH